MELDKTTIGLSLILAVVVAMLVFSASLPVMATDATQSATVTKNVTAVVIVNQSGLAANTITGWAFSGISGETNATPANSGGELQGFDASTPVTYLNNTHSGSMLVYITAGAWNESTHVGSEYYTTLDPADASAISTLFVYDTATNDISGGGLATNAKQGLWLKLELEKSGSASSTFTVESECV
ncbi:hypothetical protein C5S35_02945 [Candidatus Methanophagaceae archaeon]|nr:hypothetical protein C5S35_02945 [Methanophagales archaeon]